VKPRYDRPYPLQSFEDANETQGVFKVNTELLQNSFRVGYYSGTEQMQGAKAFPYREDNKLKGARSVVFQKDYSGNDVDIRFQINTVKFNSRLNEELQDQMNKPGDDILSVRKTWEVFTNDYLTNGR
jgi:hypothetical protein